MPKIKGAQIRDESIDGSKIEDDSLTGDDIDESTLVMTLDDVLSDGASTTVTINSGNILPSTDSTYDLGSSTKGWSNLYSDNIKLDSLGSQNEILIVSDGNKSIGSSDLLSIDTTNNRVGVGTSSPEVKLDIVGESANETQIRMAQHNSTADAPDIRMFKSRGTLSSPTAVSDNDNLAFVNSFAYDGSAYQQSGAFGWMADGTDADSTFILNTRVGGTVATRLEVLNTGDIDVKQTVIAKSYKDTVFTITDGTNVDIDPDNGGIQVWTLGANRSPTANNFDAGARVMLMINDGTNYSITWPSVNWVGGVAPTLPTSGYGIIELWKVGSQLYGAFAGGVA